MPRETTSPVVLGTNLPAAPASETSAADAKRRVQTVLRSFIDRLEEGSGTARLLNSPSVATSSPSSTSSALPMISKLSSSLGSSPSTTTDGGLLQRLLAEHNVTEDLVVEGLVVEGPAGGGGSGGSDPDHVFQLKPSRVLSSTADKSLVAISITPSPYSQPSTLPSTQPLSTTSSSMIWPYGQSSEPARHPLRPV